MELENRSHVAVLCRSIDYDQHINNKYRVGYYGDVSHLLGAVEYAAVRRERLRLLGSLLIVAAHLGFNLWFTTMPMAGSFDVFGRICVVWSTTLVAYYGISRLV